MIDAPKRDSEREAIHRKMGKMLKCYSILLLQNQRIRNNQRTNVVEYVVLRTVACTTHVYCL